MSMLCDSCSEPHRAFGGCKKHKKPVRVGQSCKDFLPTLEFLFGKDYLINGYSDPETRKMLELLARIPMPK